jgi:hypothetical protein
MWAVQSRTGFRIPAVTGFWPLPGSPAVGVGSPFPYRIVELATYLHPMPSLRKGDLVGIVTSRSARRSEVRIPAGVRDLNFLELSREALAVPQSPNQRVLGVPKAAEQCPSLLINVYWEFLRRPNSEHDHSHPYSAELKNGLSYTSTSLYTIMACKQSILPYTSIIIQSAMVLN